MVAVSFTLSVGARRNDMEQGAAPFYSEGLEARGLGNVVHHAGQRAVQGGQVGDLEVLVHG